MPGPLHGFKVVDLTQNVAGPLATMILGDQGAEIVKVEPLGGGDHTRLSGQRRAGFAASFLNNNRNKRSICIDLKAPDGVALVKRLCTGADVFMQNSVPASSNGSASARPRSVRPRRT